MNSSLLYVRVSSPGQEKEGYSLDAQEKLGHEYAARKGLTIVKSWKVSESAWRKERVAFNQMIEYAKKHDEVKHIIFDVLDRMTRNDFDKLKIYTLVKEYGKNIHFSRSNKIYNRESSSDDEFMFDIEVAVAKKQSNDISRKTKMGMIEKAAQGIYPSTAPLGYQNNKNTRILEINDEQAPFIKKAFSLMASGSHSLEMIAEQLYKEGFRTNRGKRANKSTLSHVLNNPFYYGVFHWKKAIHQGNHEPLISKTLFEQTKAVLSGKYHVATNKKIFALNNLLWCGLCGCKVLGEIKKKQYTYYHCTFSKGRHDGKGYIPENRLVKLFEEPVKQATINEDIANWVKEGLADTRVNTAQSHEKRLVSLETQLTRIKTRLNNLYDSKFDKTIDENVFQEKENEYKGQIIEIKTQLDEAEKMNPNFYEDGIQTLELVKLLHSEYVRGNLDEKANILKRIASNYQLNDITITATYRKPYIFFAKMKGCPNWLPRLDSNQNTEIQNLMSYR